MAREGARTAAAGLAPLALVGALVAYVLGPGAAVLDVGVALPEITIERVDFVDSEIRATVRNTGPIPVEIALADVNDRIQPAAVEPDGSLERFESALVRIPFEWNEAEPYAIGITTGDGTRFERQVEAAAPALEADAGLVAFLALVGTYVGIIPVMIGMLWLPFIRRTGARGRHFFLALTGGLLAFLALDSVEEAAAISAGGLAAGFNGALLVATVALLAFLALQYSSARLARAGSSGPFAAALMISVGIGLHNLGEGLAIGAALGAGSAAFGAFLIAGFALHNTTEGVAIAAPFSGGRPAVWRLAALGMVAGAPAILGAWAGGFAYSPVSSVVFLAVGAGAILQVILVLVRWLHREGGLAGAPAAAGAAAGMAVMYLTSILA